MPVLDSVSLQRVHDEVTSMLPVLNDAHKKTPPGPRTEMLEKVGQLISSVSKLQEPYLMEYILPVILQRCNDKPVVAEVANTVGAQLIDILSVQAFPHVCEVLSREITVQAKWKSKLAAFTLLKNYIVRVEKYDRDLLSSSLPQLIPVISVGLHDTRSEIADAAFEALSLALSGLTNNDLLPIVSDLARCMKERELTEETIQKLAGVVFVQIVDGAALSTIVPLITAGFRQNKSQVKRMCSRIVSNVVKLVEDPTDAAPFLKILIPALGDAIDTIPDPEARNVAEVTHKALMTILEKATNSESVTNFREQSVIRDFLLKQIGADTSAEYANALVDYISNIVFSLIKTKTVEREEYINETTSYLQALLTQENDIAAIQSALYDEAMKVVSVAEVNDDDENDIELCNCDFTLAYGTKVLLHNTRLRLLKGKKYGLVGQNDCGKTTLMRAIADGSIEGFPDRDEVRTVFVEADIQGELSHLSCVNYVLESPSIKNMNATEQMVRDMLKQVGFSEGKSSGSGGDCDDNISSLSGGWRMKLALARAMLQRADIILMDEPTNHLDVKNVKWVKTYINSLKDTSVIMVSHDSGLLNDCCDYIIQIDKLKLSVHKGNLSDFVENHPEANSYFELKASKFSFTFPQPGFLEGVKSRGKTLMKMDDVSFTYPGNTAPTIRNISVRASMASRVACVGVNGAGKSTMIKVLTGELEPTVGTVWKYPNSKIGYIAQHAFHHIEKHLTKTPNEYIRWRYEYGDDREGLDKASMKLSDADLAEIAKPVIYTWKNDKGAIMKQERVISRCSGQRRESPAKKKSFEYEVIWKDRPVECNSWYSDTELIKFNKVFEKVIRSIDQKIANKESMLATPLTHGNVEKHLSDTGLEPEYASHYRIGALSGGQKVKVVLAAALWDRPHILILDEPTNYLDRDSLGALADAIEKYEGGIIMITHNDEFCRQLCPERWVLEAGRLNTEGDVEWMTKASTEDVKFQQIDEFVDASGNEVKVKRKKKLNAKEKKKMMNHIKKKIAENEDLDSEEEEYAIEWNL
jgi:elongation factor 3